MADAQMAAGSIPEMPPITPSRPQPPLRFRHQRLLSALVFGLLLHMLYLMREDLLDEISIERRIVLVLIALRLLIMVHSSSTEPAPSRPEGGGWRAALVPCFLILPLVIGFWSAAWSTGGQLEGITSYALAASLIMLLLIVNLIVTVVQSAKRGKPKNDVVPSPYPAARFWLDSVFYAAYGLILTVGMLALLALAPEVVNDTIAVGNLAVSVYVMTWVLQGIIWFILNVSRPTPAKLAPR